MGFVESDQFWLGLVRYVIQAEAAALVGIAFGFFHGGDVGDGDAQFYCEFSMVGIATQLGLQLRAQLGQFVGLAADGGHVAFAVDDHQVTDDARLVAVRVRIFDENLRDDARILRIGDVEDAGAELLLVRDVADGAVAAFNIHLAGARQIEM